MAAKERAFCNNFGKSQRNFVIFMSEKHQSDFQSDIIRKLKWLKLDPQNLIFYELSNILEKLNFLSIKLTFGPQYASIRKYKYI